MIPLCLSSTGNSTIDLFRPQDGQSSDLGTRGHTVPVRHFDYHPNFLALGVSTFNFHVVSSFFALRVQRLRDRLGLGDLHLSTRETGGYLLARTFS